MGFGERLKKVRKLKGMSQQEVADQLGVTQQTIAQYERAESTPKLETIKKIAAALEVQYTDLFDDNEIEIIKVFKYNRKRFAEEWNSSEELKRRKMNLLMDQLNDKGQEKALDQVEMLTKIDEYKK